MSISARLASKRPLAVAIVVAAWSVVLLAAAEVLSPFGWFGLLAGGLGLLALAAAANYQRGPDVDGTDVRARLSPPAAAISIAAGSIVGLGAISIVGPPGAIVGGLVAAAVADLVPVAAGWRTTIRATREGNRSYWGSLLGVSLMVSVGLVFLALQPPAP